MPFDKNDPTNIECPTCKGRGFLCVYTPESVATPFHMLVAAVASYDQVECCSCSGLGVIPPDMRSDNAYE